MSIDLWTVSGAARELGLSRQRLYRLLERDPSLAIDHPQLGRVITGASMAKLRRRKPLPAGRPRKRK